MSVGWVRGGMVAIGSPPVIDIVVGRMADGRYEVRVADQAGSTSHVVTVPEGTVEELGVVDVDEAFLIEESFRFLLEREPKESILARFDLPVIARYFPDYPSEIKRRLGA
jgi:hypothetical protein